MRRLMLVVLLGVLALSPAPSAQQAGALRAAADALGVANLKTLQFTAAGTAYQVGQNFTAGEMWPPPRPPRAGRPALAGTELPRTSSNFMA